MTIDSLHEEVGTKPEALPHPEIQITPPTEESGWIVGFTSENPEEIEAYNYALEVALKVSELPTSSRITGTPNFHSWEVHIDTNQEELASLLPRIHALATAFLDKRNKQAA